MSGTDDHFRFDPLINIIQHPRCSLALGLLPPAHRPGHDPEAAEALARLVARLLERTGRGPAEISVLVTHRQQVAATRTALREVLGEAAAGIWCDTVERAQGREWPLVVGLHPLSGHAGYPLGATPFALEPGRLCVMLSRATAATLLLCREGVGPALAAVDPVDAATFERVRTHRALLRELWDAGRVVVVSDSIDAPPAPK